MRQKSPVVTLTTVSEIHKLRYDRLEPGQVKEFHGLAVRLDQLATDENLDQGFREMFQTMSSTLWGMLAFCMHRPTGVIDSVQLHHALLPQALDEHDAAAKEESVNQPLLWGLKLQREA